MTIARLTQSSGVLHEENVDHFGEERLLDAVEHEHDILGANSTCEMRVDLVIIAVLLEKPLLDEVGRWLEVVASCHSSAPNPSCSPADPRRKESLTIVVGEAHRKRNATNLLSEEIGLVEEEDECSVAEPGAVQNLVKEQERLLHPVLRVILAERLVVLAQTGAEQHCCHTVKAVNPLPPLTTLAPHIQHAELEPIQLKFSLVNSSTANTSSEDVLLSWKKLIVHEALDVHEEAVHVKNHTKYTTA